MTAYALRVALSFTLGGAIVFLLSFFSFAGWIPWLLTPWFSQNPGVFLFYMIYAAAFFVSGAIGGASLRLGKWATFGFGLGFLLPALGLGIPLTFAAFSAPYASLDIGRFIASAGLYGVIFSVAGAVGGAFTGHNSINRAAAVGFGVGGAIGGVLVPLPVFARRMAEGLLEDLSAELLIMICFLIPYFLGGLLLGRAAEKLKAQPGEVSTSGNSDA